MPQYQKQGILEPDSCPSSRQRRSRLLPSSSNDAVSGVHKAQGFPDQSSSFRHLFNSILAYAKYRCFECFFVVIQPIRYSHARTYGPRDTKAARDARARTKREPTCCACLLATWLKLEGRFRIEADSNSTLTAASLCGGQLLHPEQHCAPSFIVEVCWRCALFAVDCCPARQDGQWAAFHSYRWETVKCWGAIHALCSCPSIASCTNRVSLGSMVAVQ